MLIYCKKYGHKIEIEYDENCSICIFWKQSIPHSTAYRCEYDKWVPGLKKE
jgi:hypothetical protein